MKLNLKTNECIGLFLIFLGASWFGFALYGTLLAANRQVAAIPLIAGKELFIFPIFYGLSALLVILGNKELKKLE